MALFWRSGTLVQLDISEVDVSENGFCRGPMLWFMGGVLCAAANAVDSWPE